MVLSEEEAAYQEQVRQLEEREARQAQRKKFDPLESDVPRKDADFSAEKSVSYWPQGRPTDLKPDPSKRGSQTPINVEQRVATNRRPGISYRVQTIEAIQRDMENGTAWYLIIRALAKGHERRKVREYMEAAAFKDYPDNRQREFALDLAFAYAYGTRMSPEPLNPRKTEDTE